jgi:membrane protein
MVAEVRASLRDHDLMLLAAGVTFYAGLAVVPLVVVCLRVAGWLAGDAAVRHVARVLTVFVPPAKAGGLPADAGKALATAALKVPWPVLVASVLPASLYADGVQRALQRLGRPRHETGLRRVLRSRLLALAGFVFVSCGLLAVGVVGSALTQHLEGGIGGVLLGVYLAFLGGWASATVALAVCYRLGSGRALRRSALLTGAAATGSMVAGMALGLVLLLRQSVAFGRAYGGFRTAGVLATVAGWLWLVHVVVLVGFALTLRLQARLALTRDSQPRDGLRP